ncbi:MAG: hypothetical protein NTZ97_00390, partial [Candidatus Moranbacteria bacterium]|nr:hypothetical protein [Candidatus Moranbacteria bacterium]
YFKTDIWQKWDFNFGKVDTENVFQARDERAWIYKWPVAEIFKFLAPTEAYARTVSALWGILSIILIYFSASYFTKKKEIGLVSAFLFAVSISGIIFDRRLRMYSMFFAVFLAFSWMFFKFLEEKYAGQNKLIKLFWEKTGFNIIYFIPAAILGAISFLTHQLTANIVFIFILYALIQLAIIIKNKQNYINKYSVSLIILFIGYIIAAIALPKQLAIFTAGLRFFNSHWNYFPNALSDYSSIIVAIIFLALGIYFLYKKEKLSKETLWLAVSFIGTIFLAAFVWNRTAGDQYIFFIKSFGIILIASGIYFTAEFFKENLNRFGKYSFYVPLVLALLILPDYAYFFQTDNTYKQTSESSNPSYRKIFTYFKKSKNPADVLITRNFRNYYWSGAKVKVFDFGVDVVDQGATVETKKLTLDQLQNIIRENPSGWFIFSDNDEDYISNDAVNFAEKNLERVSNSQVRGTISVYRWGN